MKKIAALGLVACLGILGAACGGGEETEPAVEQELSVEAFDYYFDPTALAVDVGAAVTVNLSNGGAVSHSWTATDLDVEVEAGSGEDASVTFTAPNEPGSYDFFCKFHPDEMQGTISIGGSDEPVQEVPETDDGEDVDVDVDTEGDTSDDNY